MADINVTLYTAPFQGPRGTNADPTTDFARESTLTSMYTAITNLTTAVAALQSATPATSIGGLSLTPMLVVQF